MKKLFCTLLTATLLAHPAFAQDAAENSEAPESPLFSSGTTRGPIEISSDQLEVRQKDQVAVFTGNVLAVQGEMNLRSDKMTVYYRQNEEENEGKESVSRIDVDGNVFISNPSETASGTKGIYDVDKNELRLLGDVTLTREQNVLKGNALIYDMTTGKSVLSRTEGSKPSEGRVRALFVPSKKDGE